MRASVKPKLVPKKGYPDLAFQGYCKRFGDVLAAFHTAGIQMLIGEYEMAPRLPVAAIRYLSLTALEAEIASRIDNGTLYQSLQEVIDYWPSKDDQATLGPSPYT